MLRLICTGAFSSLEIELSGKARQGQLISPFKGAKKWTNDINFDRKVSFNQIVKIIRSNDIYYWLINMRIIIGTYTFSAYIIHKTTNIKSIKI